MDLGNLSSQLKTIIFLFLAALIETMVFLSYENS